jgi:uroporphyrinogen-III synthase
VELVGLPTAAEKVNVCIGSTSARACKAAGLHKVYHPEIPGVDGWVQSIEAALQLEDLSPKENVRDM